ncbi:MAG: N-6 DNA methylase [Bacteroidales bacterium]
MALQDALDNLLIKTEGKVLLEDAFEWLSGKYSKETINAFLNENSETYQIENNYLFSEDLLIESVIFKIKDALRGTKPNHPDFFKVVLYKFSNKFDNHFHDEKYELQIKEVEKSDRYLLEKIEHLIYPLDIQHFFEFRLRHKFTSQLFELILSEEFREYGFYTTPKTVISLFVKLLPELFFYKVYNPTAGILNLATALQADAQTGMELIASEINKRIYEYGKLLARANDNELEFNCTDSGLEIIDINDNEFDLVVSNLPFNVKIDPSHYSSKYTDLAFHIISESLRILKSDGKAVFLINESVLYSNTRNSKDFREEIVDSGDLTSIITLPTNILIHSSVKTCILIFDKSNTNDFVKYIDASTENFYVINRDKSLTLKVDKIISELDRTVKDESDIAKEPVTVYGDKSSYILALSDIRRNNYDLNLGRYLLNKMQFGDEYSFLYTFLRPSVEWMIEETESLPYIRISELNSNVIDSPEGLNINTSAKRGKRVKGPAFLIGTVGSNFKPTLFKGNFEVEVSTNIAVYKFDDKEIFAPYLLQELNAEYVKKQMNLLTKGAVIKSISKSDLAKIKIKIPPFEEQKRIYDIRIDFSEQYRLKAKGASFTTSTTSAALTATKTISDADIFQTFKHEIGNILKGPEGFFDLLPQFLSRYKIPMNSPIVENEPDTIGEMLQMSTAKINQVYDVMENMKGILFSDEKYYKPTNVELKPFLEKCLIREITNGNIKWTILINDSTTSNKKIFAEIDTNQFEYVVRNMVVNVERHGGKKEIINLLVNISSDREKTLIEFINDGEPLPAGFNIDDYVQYGKKSGETAGQGLGGYLINRVVKNHRGEINILPAGKKFKTTAGTIEANVHFSISFPKNL